MFYHFLIHCRCGAIYTAAPNFGLCYPLGHDCRQSVSGHFDYRKDLPSLFSAHPFIALPCGHCNCLTPSKNIMYTCRTAAVRLYPGATTATTNMDVAKTQAEQLRHEASIQRKKVSEVAKDLIDYCEKEKPNDTLVCGPSDSHNPFQEKKSCIVL